MADNLVKQYTKLLLGDPTATADVLNVGGAIFLDGKVYLGGTSVYIGKDGSGNIQFTDAITGTKTLAELSGGSSSSTRIENTATTSYLEYGTSGNDEFLTGHSTLTGDNSIFILEDNADVAVFDVNAQGSIFNNGKRVLSIDLVRHNVFIGDERANDTFNTSLTGNVAMGAGALDSLTTGDYNVAFGQASSSNVTNELGTVGIGFGANPLGASSVAIGHNSGSNEKSVGIGYYANRNDGGINNIAIGEFARMNGTAGSYNVAIGTNAGYYGTGTYNIMMGYSAGNHDPFSGSNNILLGYLSGSDLTTGASNIFIGAYSGRYETGTSKIMISSLTHSEQGLDEATARTKVIIYGEQSATTTNQILRVNANLQIYNATTYLSSSGSPEQLTFTDAVTGTKTLAELAGGGDVLESTVGTGGDYATISAALTAGKYNLKIISNFTEVADITLSTVTNIISNIYSINMSTYDFIVSGDNISIFNLRLSTGTITINATADKTIIIGCRTATSIVDNGTNSIIQSNQVF